MDSYWQKIFELIKRTGDRCIVVDQNSSEPFVVMSLADYEKMVFQKSPVKGLTEDQMLDRINQDIAVWKAQQFSPDLTEIDQNNNWPDNDIFLEVENDSDMNVETIHELSEHELAEDETDTDDQYYVEPVE